MNVITVIMIPRQRVPNHNHKYSTAVIHRSCKTLKDSLKSDFSMIFQKCTMKGEAHNQLHNYLKPMIGFFEGLESEDLVICKTSFIELEQYLNLYGNYFE